jgi:hypothetical protein
METVAQEALRLLEKVSEEEFITDIFTDEVNKCCAIGHIQRLKSSNTKDYNMDNCKDSHISSIRMESEAFGKSIAKVNNMKFRKYQQETPKERVIALLNDMIAAGY